MAKRKLFFLALCVSFVSSLMFFGWQARDYVKDRSEFLLLEEAYGLRSNYEVGSRVYFRNLGGVRKNRHLAFYNLGNLSFRGAVLSRDAALLASAAEYYKAALRIQPDFPDAKKNLEIVSSLLKSLEKEIVKPVPEDKEKGKGAIPGLVPYQPNLP